MYKTLIGEVVVLINVSFGLPVPLLAGLLIPSMDALLQLKLVSGVTLVGTYENTVLLHIAGGICELESVTTGFTTTSTLYVDGPAHPFDDKVYTYVTFTGEGDVLKSASAGSPVPEAAGLLIAEIAARLQLNVTPAVKLVGV